MDGLANTSNKSFYPLRIPVSHWQLRHYISHPEPDVLYYASGHDIYALNTASKKRKLLVTLPFEARCTAGGYGWICVGGEDEGHFAAIKVDGGAHATAERWGEGQRAASVKVERIGDEIVNSISIHRVQDEDAHLDDIVAVLTNNDKTVRVYSLPQSLETRVLDLPFAMNHATISPDGQTMIAVGDYNKAFFFRREILSSPPQIHKPHNRLTSSSLGWTLTSVVDLRYGDAESTRGFFTTAWSPNGRLVATGSEGGYITVFDVDMLVDADLDDRDAVVAVVPSSRPDVANPYPGAVRSMMFSPEPWDLLVWAEDQGRVCIGDLRTGLKTRQVVSLDPKDKDLDRIVLDELEPESNDFSVRDLDELEQEFLSRYRNAGDNATAANFANDYIEARRRTRVHQIQSQRQETANAQQAGQSARDDGNTRLRQMRERRRMNGEDPQGLTPQEQVILDTLRATRQREEARSQGGNPRTVNYTTPDLFRDTGGGERSRSGTPGNNSTPATRPISDLLYSVPDAGFPELSRTQAAGSPRPTSSHGRDLLRDMPSITPRTPLPPPDINDGTWGNAARGNTGLVRLSDGSRLPRRRASVMLTPPATNSSGSTTTATPNQPATRANQATAEEDPEDDNPWRTIEEHMSLQRGPLFESAGRVQASSPLPAPTRTTDPERNSDPRARVQARQRERWQSLRADLSGEAPAARSTTAEAAERAALDRWERASGVRLPAFMSQGGDILLRRSQWRGQYQGREVGVRTAGLAMSADGRTLWAACEEGIFEVDVKVKNRFFWPAVTPR